MPSSAREEQLRVQGGRPRVQKVGINGWIRRDSYTQKNKSVSFTGQTTVIREMG